MAPAAVAVASEALACLRSAVAALGAEPLRGRPADALSGDILELRRQIDLLEVEGVRRLSAFEAARDPRSRQARPLIHWLRESCGLSGGAAAERVEVALHLDELPLCAEALSQGDLCFEKAAVLARAVRDMGADTVRGAEASLLEVAGSADAGELRRATRDLRHRLDPGGGLEAANRLHERRFLNVSQRGDGGFSLDGLLDPEAGARLRTALDPLTMPAPGDRRSAGQRMADALTELATRQLGEGSLPRVAGQRPHLALIVHDATLRGEPGAPSADLVWAGPVAAETARRLACDASVSTVRVDGGGTPLDVGRATRTIPPAIRTALVVRDRHCRFPGCNRPPCWTDAHHLQDWIQGGHTRLDNLALLCRRHHRSVHEGGWKLRRRDGELVAEPP